MASIWRAERSSDVTVPPSRLPPPLPDALTSINAPAKGKRPSTYILPTVEAGGGGGFQCNWHVP
jgi:hypothetical protein